MSPSRRPMVKTGSCIASTPAQLNRKVSRHWSTSCDGQHGKCAHMQVHTNFAPGLYRAAHFAWLSHGVHAHVEGARRTQRAVLCKRTLLLWIPVPLTKGYNVPHRHEHATGSSTHGAKGEVECAQGPGQLSATATQAMCS